MNKIHNQNIKKNIVNTILLDKKRIPQQAIGTAFAPSNIALCKYWGKRDVLLNLPVTNSLSVSLNEKGAKTCIGVIEGFNKDIIVVNNQIIHEDTAFAKALSLYLDLFRENPSVHFRIETHVNIPIAAGLASSACGFAAVIKALNKLYGWNLELRTLSVLARLGSGSACRSLWEGFVEWQRGSCAQGLDSYALPIATRWPALRIGLLIFETEQKKVSSRMAMEHTVKTSPFYEAWPNMVDTDLKSIKQAIQSQDFNKLGAISEANALAMHALMMTARPSVVYSTPDTLKTQQQIWACRDNGLSLYFTQDAGPNIKLLFLADETEAVTQMFPNIDIIVPFGEV